MARTGRLLLAFGNPHAQSHGYQRSPAPSLLSSSYFRNFLQDDHATAFVPSPSHFCQKVWSEFLRLPGDAISIQEYIYILLKAPWPSSECSISYLFIAIAISFKFYR
ncbi:MULTISPECIES: hypothetical protein [Trichocoleus]|uniref:Uncharacterized protein n=1 Tax=Trichocoleus desertorum GB2-A4 TaxID=2933944 RepID=A0ABV0JE78_9CYAN|nr:hypothetical protein [Trichocoleus sp. FACHB-46]MBD1862695.1 hypothetical protein [Trichocoleus sp. FACHB-46]